ncbi:MAG: ferredoxin [Bavariicoccus seileri]|uniref:ferredoxin n=1 Tax=Bavariicoccus seileri TaxID=549685 RepID=UPI003F8DD30F
MYCKVNQTECIACGICQLAAPNLFDYTNEGIAYFVPDNNSGRHPLNPQELIKMKIAYHKCPTGAIKRSETPFPNS